MSDENNAQYDEQLPVVADPVEEPQAPVGEQNFRVTSAVAGQVYKKNPRSGLSINFSSTTNPGTKGIYKQVPVPTQDESKVASDTTGLLGLTELGWTQKQVQAARMRVQEWKALTRIFDIPDGLSLNGVAAALKDREAKLKAKLGKPYTNPETGETRPAQVEVDLLAKIAA